MSGRKSDDRAPPPMAGSLGDRMGFLPVGKRFPRFGHPEWGERVPRELIGARIVRFGGGAPEHRLEGGGLLIDFIPKGKRAVRQIVFYLNSSGMWVERKSA